MSRIDPLPFRLRTPGSDTVGFDGVRSISYRLEGLLHLADRMVTLEWTGTQRTQEVGFGGIRDEVDHFPVEWLDIPADWLTDVRVKGGWWRPRLELRSRRIDAFGDTPGVRGGALTLRIRRQDRELARAMAHAIREATEPVVHRLAPDEDDTLYLGEGNP